jgi:hypothetical protein
MVLWPQPIPGTNLTSSPYMDELKHKSNELKLQAAELNEARSKLLLEEKTGHQTKQQRKPGKPEGE